MSRFPVSRGGSVTGSQKNPLHFRYQWQRAADGHFSNRITGYAQYVPTNPLGIAVMPNPPTQQCIRRGALACDRTLHARLCAGHSGPGVASLIPPAYPFITGRSEELAWPTSASAGGTVLRRGLGGGMCNPPPPLHGGKTQAAPMAGRCRYPSKDIYKKNNMTTGNHPSSEGIWRD